MPKISPISKSTLYKMMHKSQKIDEKKEENRYKAKNIKTGYFSFYELHK